jgi:putative phosphoribosyl transferase
MEQLAARVSLGQIELNSEIVLPDRAVGLVLFAHGSGSILHSPRNRKVAGLLHRNGLGTILVDLLTGEEEAIDRETGELRYAVHLLGHRVAAITDWIVRQPDLQKLPLGYFGASTGTAAVLVAAAERPNVVRALVSRGGRPDCAGPALSFVQAPTLFIVGRDDETVMELTYPAAAQLPRETKRKIVVIDGASHLFEEPGKLEKVAALAGDWFLEHLAPAQSHC